jgi:hypothetical protein
MLLMDDYLDYSIARQVLEGRQERQEFAGGRKGYAVIHN